MNNRTGIKNTGNQNINIPRLTVITAVMAAGAAAGSIYTAHYTNTDFFTLSQLQGTELFRQLAVFHMIPVFAAFLSSYFGYGAVIALCAALCRGFAFSAPLTKNIMANGLGGYFSFTALGSICGILSVLAVIIMSMQAIEISSVRRENKLTEDDQKNTFVLFVCCAAAIILGAAMDAYMMK